ncbi:PQQ-like beta-propeller repeat protein [bacterium]|nr:PQQ-like beta-propeller repeat protein [bacterium]
MKLPTALNQKTARIRELAFFSLIFITMTGFTEDWPQWRGLNRDGISKETGILKNWSASGPKVLWRIPLGPGYSSLAVSQGRVYTMTDLGTAEVAICLNASTGEQLWSLRMDSSYQSGQGDGPRSTPTVDGNFVYALGAQGKLYALNAKDGKKIWFHETGWRKRKAVFSGTLEKQCRTKSFQ